MAESPSVTAKTQDVETKPLGASNEPSRWVYTKLTSINTPRAENLPSFTF